ncbi:MAG: UDP-N-acetylmuramoyl-tripeptide--D-alanyl-D-alanine ligase [Bacteroidetes bacterium]|nr:UDP-N-acetylmuramoyl-tripeptide--D-alanyl-D-alanine ligase [Bacteroidota bacterium]
MRTEEIYSIYKKSAGVSTDSRTIRKGQIFFALDGPNYNGNMYAADAVRAGAVCAIVDDPDFETGKTILVDDSLRELQALASMARNDLKSKVIAITGSNGKTTTRELVAAVLSTRYKTCSSAGNLNNHIGVPLTILSCSPDAEMLVVEMGANHAGEISRLCTIARPHIGIITNIGTAHIEGFGSIEGVKKAKSELYEYLKKTGGIVFYNESDPVLTELIYKMVVKAVPFSDPAGTDLITETRPEELLLSGRIVYEGSEYKFGTNLFGNHNHQNIRAAMATGLFHDVPVGDVLSAIESYVPSNNRSQVLRTERNTIVCDAYNANPVSMASAIDSFSKLAVENKVCIIGDMLELGELTGAEHEKILKQIANSAIEICYTVGPVFMALSPLYGFRAFDTVERLVEALSKTPLTGKTVLIKGSRGIRLEKCYEVL